jgi:hypothetical protein
MEITGIMLCGTTTFLNSEDGSFVSSDPVYLPASVIDAAISGGSLKAGAFNGVSVSPPREEWPARWQHLREQ